MSASSASPKASSSDDSVSTRTPEAPLASRNTVSLVDSWPSTEMRSNERFTHTPVSRSTVSGASAASVSTKQNIVAKRGEIMPAPLACAASRTVPEGSSSSKQARFGPRSVVRIESQKSRVSPPSDAAAWRTPSSRGSRGSSRPITPVEASPTCSGFTPSSSAASACEA